MCTHFDTNNFLDSLALKAADYERVPFVEIEILIPA